MEKQIVSNNGIKWQGEKAVQLYRANRATLQARQQQAKKAK